MTETDGRRWLKSRLMMSRHSYTLQPIESGGTGIGIPDIVARTLTHDVWVELKLGKFINNLLTVTFRPGQLPWIRKHVSLNGKVTLLVFAENFDNNDFSWWAFKDHEIKECYTFDECSRVGYLTGRVRPDTVYDNVLAR